MAGGFLLKSTNKSKPTKSNGYNNEVLRESSASKPKKITLAGILGLNQTVEINKKPQKKENSEKDFIKNFLNQLQKEQQTLVDHKQLEIKQEIKSLQEEIKKLNNASEELNHEVTQATLVNVVDSSEYQLNFLLRLKKLIVSLRENVSEASLSILVPVSRNDSSVTDSIALVLAKTEVPALKMRMFAFVFAGFAASIPIDFPAGATSTIALALMLPNPLLVSILPLLVK